MEIHDALTLISHNVKKNKKHIFKDAGTTDLFYGTDQLESFKLNTPGRDSFTQHIIQNTDWSVINFDYKWNSLGLRGPEPDYSAKRKILFAGGSLCVGTGVPLEHSFPHILSDMAESSYINLSDVDTISDLIIPLKKFKNFNPDVVVISDTIFIQYHGWILMQFFKEKSRELKKAYRAVFAENDRNFLLMFDSFLGNLFPNSKIILACCNRKYFKFLENENNYQYMKVVLITQQDIVDLARDNHHAGIASHKLIAEKIFKSIY